VHEEGAVCAEGKGHEATPASLDCGDDRHREHDEEQEEPDRTEFSQRLEIEAVCVAHFPAARPVLEPEALERPRS
jgi:hypothetical protein